MMIDTRDVQETIQERIQNDPEFEIALLDEIIALFQSDESETARLVLRDFVESARFTKPQRNYFGTHFVDEPNSLL